MNKEIFYLYRLKHKCPYSDPLIQTMLLVLCDCVSLCCVSVLIIPLSFIFSVSLKLMGKEGTVRVS